MKPKHIFQAWAQKADGLFCNARMIVKWTILCIGYIRTFIFISLQGCIKKARKTPNNVNEESKLKRKSYNRYEKSNKESFTPDAAPRRDSTQRNATQSVWTLSAYSMCLIKAKFHYAIQLASRSLARLRPAREPAALRCVASRCSIRCERILRNLQFYKIIATCLLLDNCIFRRMRFPSRRFDFRGDPVYKVVCGLRLCRDSHPPTADLRRCKISVGEAQSEELASAVILAIVLKADVTTQKESFLGWKYKKSIFGRGSAPDQTWGAYSTPRLPKLIRSDMVPCTVIF